MNYKGGKRKLNCRFCGKEFEVFPYRLYEAKFCSRSCNRKSKVGILGANWRGGKQKTGKGYIHIKRPDHPFADKRGRIYEHRFMMEQKLGRYLSQKEVVDHINGITGDNRLENLRLFSSNGEHCRVTLTGRTYVRNR